jgi:RND family efflux transporter MFP subunit
MRQTREGKRWPGTLAAVVGAVAITGLITAGLHARVDDVAERPGRGAMPVAAVSFDQTSGYDREQRFLGVVRAATGSDIGFEVAGAVARLDVREGDTVEVGAALARLDTRSLEARRQAAAATVEQIRAELELAQARSQRQAPLVRSGAISAQTFDDTRLSEKALSARLEAARAALTRLEIDLEKSVLRAPYAARIGRKHVDVGTVT